MKSFFWKYLAISSIFLHVIFIGALVMALPRAIQEAHTRLAEGKMEGAVVRDVSTLTDGEYSYQGYFLEYNGKPLYVEGRSNENIHIGDEVSLSFVKLPLGSPKSLIIMAEKQRPNKQRDSDSAPAQGSGDLK